MHILLQKLLILLIPDINTQLTYFKITDITNTLIILVPIIHKITNHTDTLHY